MLRRNRTAGTTLIEILVVMVIFLIGILAILQIFPGGFKVLTETRRQSMATQLSRTEVERLKARVDQLADMILPVNYTFVTNAGATVVNIAVDMNSTPNNLGPNGNEIDINGNVLSGGNNLGYWAYLTGANKTRRVVGEGGPIPAPRPVAGQFGGLMVLQFSPIVYNAAYPALFQVYGNDMVKREGAPFNPGAPTRPNRRYFYYLENADDDTATIWLPRNPNKDISYRLAMSAWVTSGGQTQQRDLIDIPIPVNQGDGYAQVPLAALVAGASFDSVLYDTVRVARAFEQVVAFADDNDPYEYMLLDPNMGILLFDPEGHDWKEVRANGQRIPLVARVSYDVFDWRILREEFRVPDTAPLHYRVAVGDHKIQGRPGTDGIAYPGMNVFVQDGSGGTENRDFLLVDLDSGGIYTKNSLQIDKSLGLITFVDVDGNAGNGLQSQVILPGQTSPTMIDSAGRSVRALYQANSEWAVQVMKAPAQYNVSYGLPLGIAQFYALNPWGPSVGGRTRIYFPRIDVGKKVSIREIWYEDAGGNVFLIQNQDFVLRSASNDPLGPFVDITEVAPDAVDFNYSRGYAIRGVKGASVMVRVLYNPSFFTLSNDHQDNLERFDRWGRTWKKNTTDTYLQRGEIY